jgi:hypothetical protein
MLWSMAHPQRTIPTLITILVVMAGVDGNWMMVYKTISEVGENRTEKRPVLVTQRKIERKSETKHLKRTREKNRNGDKESGHGANTSDGRISQEFFDSIINKTSKKLNSRNE